MTDAPKESQEPGAPKEPQYKDVSETELKRVLAEHDKWVETAGEEGAQANLKGAHLQGANLQGAMLQEAQFQKASLAFAKLHGANLEGADLRLADLRGANLLGAKLQGADLRGAKNLTQEQLDEACGDEKTELSEGLTIETCLKEQEEGSNDG